MDGATPIRTLIIEDNEDDVLLLLNVIRKGGFFPDFLHVASKHGLFEALKSQWDIIFSDYTMPNFNGHEALEIVRKEDPDVPFFFVSGTIGEDRAVEAMRLGAQDYFIKGNLKRLPSAIHRELRDSDTRREHRLGQQRLHYLANYDLLTGLPNRTLFIDKLDQCLAEARLAHTALAVFGFNIKRFKDVNDHLGAAVGDSLLIELASRLVAAMDEGDTVARLGADEFAIICRNLKDAANTKTVAGKLLAVLGRPFSLSRYEWRVHASIGGSVFPRDGAEGDELLSNATIALHHAQQLSGNNYLEYSRQMRTLLQEKLGLGHALEQALEKNQFQLHYQPQAAAADGRIVGVEALIRWQRPGCGTVCPDQFIPLAESSGLIVPLGEWVLREACRQAQYWRTVGLTSLRVAVNFSTYQFRQPDLVATVARTLREFELPSECLEIEITESALMQDAATALAMLHQLHDMGVSIALDDFGTGYSSLSYLKRFPVDVLKIDRGFVGELPHDEGDAAIVRAIIAMAEKLHLKVIAEGVETKEQMLFLRDAGCDFFQGYYLQRPIAAGDVLAFCNSGYFAG